MMREKYGGAKEIRVPSNHKEYERGLPYRDKVVCRTKSVTSPCVFSCRLDTAKTRLATVNRKTGKIALRVYSPKSVPRPVCRRETQFRHR